MTTRSGKRYALSILSDDGQSQKIVRLNPTAPSPQEQTPVSAVVPLTQIINAPQVNVNIGDTENQYHSSRISIEHTSDLVPSADENVLSFSRIPDVAMRVILKHFTKLELFQLMGITNQRWRNLIYDALHCHRRLTLLIGPESATADYRYVFPNNLSDDHLRPPSAEAKKHRPETLRFDQLNWHLYDWLRFTFPQIRVFEAQFNPTFLSTEYIRYLLRAYSAQLVTLRLSAVLFRYFPIPLLHELVHLKSLRHLTLHGFYCCSADSLGNALQILSQLESFHFSMKTGPIAYRNLMDNITKYGVSNARLKEITLNNYGSQPNAQDVRNLPVIVKQKIVKLRLNLSASAELAPALLNCSSLRVLVLHRIGEFPFERLLAPLVEFTQLRHLQLELHDNDFSAYLLRKLLTPAIAQTVHRPLPSITSLTLMLITTSHQSLTGFPFADIFTGVKWVRLNFSKFRCHLHPFENSEMRKECNRLLVFPLAACPKMEKIYAFSFHYRPLPNEPFGDDYLNNETTLQYEWVTPSCTAEETSIQNHFY